MIEIIVQRVAGLAPKVSLLRAPSRWGWPRPGQETEPLSVPHWLEALCRVLVRIAPRPSEVCARFCDLTSSWPVEAGAEPQPHRVLPPGRSPAFQGTKEGSRQATPQEPIGEALSMALGSEVTPSPATKWEEGQPGPSYSEPVLATGAPEPHRPGVGDPAPELAPVPEEWCSTPGPLQGLPATCPLPHKLFPKNHSPNPCFLAVEATSQLRLAPGGQGHPRQVADLGQARPAGLTRRNETFCFL